MRAGIGLVAGAVREGVDDVRRSHTWVGVRRHVGQLARDACITARLRTASRRVLPDFLIVGAQRSGTTSLYCGLLAHPSFVAPLLRRKGVHYFDTGYTHGLDWYRAHFPLASAMQARSPTHGHKVTGEASPYYMFHPAAPERIARDLPGVKLVVVLRDPVMRAHSHYQHMRWEGHEPLATFELALSSESSRLAGEEDKLLRDPAYRSFSHQHHAYARRGLYARQLERLFDHVDPSRVLVTSSALLFSDPASQLARIVEFVGLEPHGCAAPLGVHNSTRVDPMQPTTYRWLRDYYEEPNRDLHDLLGWRVFPWP